MTKPNAPAFPTGGFLEIGGGLTKREEFAKAAMQGLCVPCTPGRHNANDSAEAQDKARMAVALADALIVALNKEVSNG